VNLSDIKVRYWFTSDGNEQNNFVCDYAAFGTDKVKGIVKKIENSVPGADTYCEISFTEDAGRLAPGGSTGTIPFRMRVRQSMTRQMIIPIILKCQMILG